MSGPLNSSSPSTSIVVGGVYNATTPSPVNKQALALQQDSSGNLLVNVVKNAPVAGVTVGTQYTQIASSTSETTIVTAGATGVYNDITGMQITNQSSTAVTVTIKDSTGGTTRKVFDLAANGGIVVNWQGIPLPQSAAHNNWTATLSVNTVTVDINVDFIETTQAGE